MFRCRDYPFGTARQQTGDPFHIRTLQLAIFVRNDKRGQVIDRRYSRDAERPERVRDTGRVQDVDVRDKKRKDALFVSDARKLRTKARNALEPNLDAGGDLDYVVEGEVSLAEEDEFDVPSFLK